jgi:poly(3-hydroxybutyrate) depolymerase
VSAYLRADDQYAERLLPRLAGRSVEELAPVVHAVLTEPPPSAAPTGMLPNRPIRVDEDDFSYALYVPASYDPARAYPLVLCLHGAGFGGDAYLARWQPRLKEDYLLACPTIDGGAWWTREAEGLVLAVLGEVSRTYHIDPERVFLTGMSNGGTGTFLIGTNHPDRFAALIPMASAFPRALYPLLDNAKALPLYIIHGSRDQVMPVQYSRDLSTYLEREGFQVVYREHDKEHPVAGGHFFPRDELPSLVEWLTTQHRAPTPRRITAVRDRDHTDRVYWVRVDKTTSDVASFWTSERDPEESQRLQNGAWARIEAAIDGQTISVTTERIARYTILLDDRLMDLSQPIRVVTNEKPSFEGRVQPDASLLLREARKRPDPAGLVVAAVAIAVP